MKILNNIMRYMALVLIVLSANSCLEKFPGDAYEDKDWESIYDAEQELIGTYALMKSSALYSGYLTLLPDLQTDLAYAVEGFSNTYGDIWQWKLRSTTREIEAVYASLYTVIGQCNHYLAKYEKLRPELVSDSQIDALDSWTGEIYGIRALCYSELIKCFCKAYPLTDSAESDDEAAKKELGVVLRTEYYKEETAKRSNLYDSWNLVFEDLSKAESMIDEDEDSYNTVWFTRAAAYSLHARAALYTGKWDEAVKYSTLIIDSGDFRLADASANYTSDTDVLTGASRNLSYYQYLWDYDSSFEIILKVGFTTTSYGGSLGQVFHNYNRGSRLFYPDYTPANWVVNLYNSGDLRQSAFFAQQQTGYSGYPDIIVLMKYFGNRTFISSAIYHVSMPKVFRLSEQYLIRSEAYCRKGRYSEASADLTTLRKARFSGGNGSISVGENNWLDQISDERVRELYMEGFRLNDLKRWGRGFERTPQTMSLTEGSSLKISADDYRFVWPIPNHEIESPGTDLEQNFGY